MDKPFVKIDVAEGCSDEVRGRDGQNMATEEAKGMERDRDRQKDRERDRMRNRRRRDRDKDCNSDRDCYAGVPHLVPVAAILWYGCPRSRSLTFIEHPFPASAACFLMDAQGLVILWLADWR